VVGALDDAREHAARCAGELSRRPMPSDSSPSPRVAAPKPWLSNPSAAVGTFFALFAALLVFAYSSTDLLRFPDRAVGIGLLQGIDPARRFPIYLSIVAASLGVWLAFDYAARALRARVPGWFLGVRSRLENDLCATLAAVGSVSLIARVAIDRLDGLGSAHLCLAGLLLVASAAWARRRAPAKSVVRRGFSSLNTLGPLLFLAWPGAQIATVLAGVGGAEGRGLGLLGAVLLPAVYGAASFCRLRWPGRATRAQVRQAFTLGAAPWFAFPALCPFANEIQHTLARRYSFEARSVALAFLALLALVASGLFWQAQRGRLRVAPGRTLSHFGFPALVFGATLLDVYRHQLAGHHVDPLHDGEQITAVHQLLSFDKWPFVDVWPAHGLFDYLGALYSSVNGFEAFELTAWNDVLTALSATMAYAILARVSTPFFALLVAVLLPIESIFPLPQYSFFYAEAGLLAVGLLGAWTLARPSTARYAILSLSCFLCFFWTPTSGVASILAVFALLVLTLITTRHDRRSAWRGLGVFALTGAGVLLAYLLLLVVRGQPVFDTLRLVRAFMQADPLIGGRPSVIKDFDTLAFFQYVALPGIGLLYLVRLARHAIERRPLDHIERILAFLTIVSFVLFARTLTRHGITERYQPFFFPFLALAWLMPRRVGRALLEPRAGTARDGVARAQAVHFAHRGLSRAWFCAGLAVYLVLFPVTTAQRAAFEPFGFHDWQRDEKRFGGKTPSYPALQAFLGSTLRPGETFLELLNMPLLYALFDRELPGQFFLPTMFYATDSVQKSFLARLEAFGGAARVPVVLLPLKGGKRNNIDRIENALRSFRIAEHVYRDYVPIDTLNEYEVWLSRARWAEAAQGIAPRPLSFLDPSGYRVKSVEPPRLESGALQIASNGPDPQVDGAVAVDGVVLGGLASYHVVRFLYRTSAPGTLEMFFRFAGSKYNPEDSGRATLSPGAPGEWTLGQVAVPRAGGTARALTGLRLDPPDRAQFEIKSLELVFDEPPRQEVEAFSTGMLPFFWGNFDASLGSGAGTVLENLAVPPAGAAVSAFDLSWSTISRERTSSYLQLCLRIPGAGGAPSSALRRWRSVKHGGGWLSAGKVTLRYGAEPQSTFDFELVRPDLNAPGMPEALARSFEHECKRYVVRLSAQYAWSSRAVSKIRLDSSVPIVIEAAQLLVGD
jgi:hypothetical protein